MIDLLNRLSLAGFSGGLIVAGLMVALSVPAVAQNGGCRGGTTLVCGANIPLPDMTPVGDVAKVHVPASVLGDSYAANANLYFTAACVSDQLGAVAYRVVDVDKIPCNAFPCQASSIRLCDMSIAIPAGTPLGGIVHMNMPPPYTKGSFTVQCVGNLDEPPVYQVTDHASVACNAPPPAP